MSDYNTAFDKLTTRVRQVHQAHRGWNPTTTKREMQLIAKALVNVAELLDADGSAQSDIEAEHDQPTPPVPDPAGYPQPVEAIGASYKATIGHIRELAASATRAADRLPDSRTKHALPFAALALLHLRYHFEFPGPTLYEQGADMIELQTLCRAAGIHLSPRSLRDALTDALQQFDPTFCPYHIDDIFV